MPGQREPHPTAYMLSIAHTLVLLCAVLLSLALDQEVALLSFLHFLCLCLEKPCAGKALYTRTGCLPGRLMEPVVLLLPSPAYAYK